MRILQPKTKVSGVTLLEVLLVLAIASSLLVMLLNYTTQKSNEARRDKTVLQMQQILNAGMSFYVNNSFWPINGATITNTQCGITWGNLTAMQPPNSSYLPSTLNNNPYVNPYKIGCTTVSNGGGFYVVTTADNTTDAEIIAGRLPMAYLTNSLANLPPIACSSPPANNCNIVVANVNIPGQNLNNARSVNFAGVYYSGSCVPAPVCPPNMAANIMVMPAAISGVNDSVTCSGSTINTCWGTAYPVSSFIAYAVGNTNGNGKPVDPKSGPSGCQQPPVAVPCILNQQGQIIPSDGTLYWRVCLSVRTEKGVVVPNSPNMNLQGQMMGTLIAITRCVPNNGAESPSGSINVYQY